MRAKKLLSVVLALIMVLSLVPAAALAANYGDAEGHWAEAAINRWSDYGIVTGDERGFRPNDNMTRAEAAKVLCELFGLTSTKGAAAFTDVPADAWFAGYIAKANAAGILNGVGDNQADPNGTLTRETFFVMFARGLGLKEQSTTSGVAADGDSWANGYINALTDKGYVKGMDGKVNALANINRASVMSLLDQTVAQYINTSGAVALTAESGIVLVNAKDVTLTGTTNADIVIAKGADGGSVAFQGATVNGAVTVQADNAKVTADKNTKLAATPVVNGAGTTYTAADGTSTTTPANGGNTTPRPGSVVVLDDVPLTVVSAITITAASNNDQARDNATGAPLSTTVAYEKVTITSDVGDGTVTLEDVNIAGDLIVEGGGPNSVHLKNCRIGGRIVVDHANTRLVLEEGTAVGKPIIAKQATVIETDAQTTVNDVRPEDTLTIQGADTKVNSITVPEKQTNKADGTEGSANGAVTVKVASGAKVTSLTDATAGKTTLNVEDATVSAITASAGSMDLKVEKANISTIAANTTGTVDIASKSAATDDFGTTKPTVTAANGTVNVKADVNAVNVPATAAATTTLAVQDAAVGSVQVNKALNNPVAVTDATISTVAVNADNGLAISGADIGTVNADAKTTVSAGVGGNGGTIGTIAATDNVTINDAKASVGTVAVTGTPSGATETTVTVEKGNVDEVTASVATTVAASASGSGTVANVTASTDGAVTVDADVVSKVTVPADNSAANIAVTDASYAKKLEVEVQSDSNTDAERTVAITGTGVDANSTNTNQTVQVTSNTGTVASGVTAGETAQTATAVTNVTMKSETPKSAVLSKNDEPNDTLTITFTNTPDEGGSIKVYSDSTKAAEKMIGSAHTITSAEVTAKKVAITIASPSTAVLGDVYVTYTGKSTSSVTYTESDGKFSEGYYLPLAAVANAQTTYAIPASTVGTAITPINVKNAVVGGKGTLTFTSSNLPAGLSVSTDGIISGTPTTAGSSGTATITVTDSDATPNTKSVTIDYGTISKAASPIPTATLSKKTAINDTLTVTLSADAVAGDVIHLFTAKPTVTGETISDTNKLSGMETYTVKSEDVAKNARSIVITLGGTQTTAITNASGALYAVYAGAGKLPSQPVKATGYVAALTVGTPSVNLSSSLELKVGTAITAIDLTAADKANVSGGNKPYTFAVKAAGEGETNALPAGLSLSSDGKITGTPTTKTNGTSTTVFTVKDADGTSANNEITVTWPAVTAGKPEAPTGLIGVAPTTEDGKGAINGTATTMEYSDAESGSYTACSASSTAVAAGTWYVRYAATDNADASDPARVVVPAYQKLLAVFTVTDGSKAIEGATVAVTSTENGASPSNQTTDENGVASFTLDSTKSYTYTVAKEGYTSIGKTALSANGSTANIGVAMSAVALEQLTVSTTAAGVLSAKDSKNATVSPTYYLVDANPATYTAKWLTTTTKTVVEAEGGLQRGATSAFSDALTFLDVDKYVVAVTYGSSKVTGYGILQVPDTVTNGPSASALNSALSALSANGTLTLGTADSTIQLSDRSAATVTVPSGKTLSIPGTLDQAENITIALEANATLALSSKAGNKLLKVTTDAAGAKLTGYAEIGTVEITGSGTLTIDTAGNEIGTLSVASGATVTINGNTVANNGTLTLADAGTFNVADDATLIWTGTLTLDEAGIAKFTREFTVPANVTSYTIDVQPKMAVPVDSETVLSGSNFNGATVKQTVTNSMSATTKTADSKLFTLWRLDLTAWFKAVKGGAEPVWTYWHNGLNNGQGAWFLIDSKMIGADDYNIDEDMFFNYTATDTASATTFIVKLGETVNDVPTEKPVKATSSTYDLWIDINYAGNWPSFTPAD